MIGVAEAIGGPGCVTITQSSYTSRLSVPQTSATKQSRKPTPRVIFFFSYSDIEKHRYMNLTVNDEIFVTNNSNRY